MRVSRSAREQEEHDGQRISGIGAGSHRNRCAHFRAEPGERRTQPLGKGFNQQRMLRPSFGEVDAQTR